MAEQEFEKINEKLLLGVQFHNEAGDLFWYCSLHGFAMLHEVQAIKENLYRRRIKKIAMSTYCVAIIDVLSDANLLSPLTKNLNRSEITATDIQNIIKYQWQAYIDWEKESLDYYEKCAIALFQEGCIADFNLVNELVVDVKAELRYILDLGITLQGMNFDMAGIVDMQPDLAERMYHELHNMFCEDKPFHHFNSALTEKDINKMLVAKC